MNVTRKSYVKVMGHSVRVPNWFIWEPKRWSPEKISRVEERAARLGQLQTFVMASPLYPAVVLILAFLFFGLAIGTIEHSF